MVEEVVVSDRASAVLGIDAAWSIYEPSGIALWRWMNGSWTCVRVAPSYETFCGPLDWEGDIEAGPIDVPRVLETCRQLLNGVQPNVVAASIPLSATPVRALRACDQMLEKRFRGHGFAIPRPDARVPGAAGVRLYDALTTAGYQTPLTPVSAPRQVLLEVNPSVGLLGLPGRKQGRLYKAQRTRRYWPQVSPATRAQLVLQEWRSLVWRLQSHARGIDIPLPQNTTGWSVPRLQRFEDAIDALICAWMATEFLGGRLKPMGDSDGAIWVPQSA